MSKLKSKKLSKSTIAIILMAFALVALISFGATFALFTATATQRQATIKTGKITLTSNSTLVSNANRVFPGQALISGAVTVTPNTDTTQNQGVAGSADTQGEYVAVKFTIGVENANDQAITVGDVINIVWSETTEDNKTYVWAQVPGNTNVYVYSERTGSVGSYTYTPVGMKTATEVLTGITFDAYDNWDQTASATEGYISQNGYMDATISISIEFKAVQVTANNQNKTITNVATDVGFI